MSSSEGRKQLAGGEKIIQKYDIWDLAEFQDSETVILRNSYRTDFCYIYEAVKLGQIETSFTWFDYSESEYRFKAFIDSLAHLELS